MNRKAFLLSVVLGLLLLSSASSAFAATSSHTSATGTDKAVTTASMSQTDIDVFGEFSDLFIGKGGAGIYTFRTVGGDIQLPINTSWQCTQQLEALHIGVGMGHRWWLYYHRDLFPDIPPAISLSVKYDLGHDQAVAKAKALVDRLNQTIGVRLKPFWTTTEYDETTVAFASAFSPTFTVNFMKTEIFSRFPTDGQSNLLNSSIVDENLAKQRYTRAAISLRLDDNDIDKDSNVAEYVPTLFFGTAVPSFIDKEGDWYQFSVKEDVLGAPEGMGNITSHPEADISSFKVHFPIPIEVNRTITTIPDNPMFEYKGRLNYVLKYGDRHQRELSDINVAFNLLNMTKELETMPVVTSSFLVKGGQSYTYNETAKIDAMNFTFVTEIQNRNSNEGSAAKDVHVTLPFPKNFIHTLRRMRNWYEKETGVHLNLSDLLDPHDWNLSRTISTGYITQKGAGLTAHIPSLPANGSVRLEFNLTVFPGVVFKWDARKFDLHFPTGPQFYFHDADQRRYAGFANGFALLIKRTRGLQWNMSYVFPITLSKSGEMEREEELRMRFDFGVHVMNMGNSKLSNVNINLFRARPKGYYRYERPRVVDRNYTSEVKAGSTYSTNLSFVERLKVGPWLTFSSVHYEALNESYTVFSNAFTLYIPPVQWITQRWQQRQEYPYPHVRLSLEKDASLNITANRLHISLNVTHEGSEDDPSTPITVNERILTDYVNTTVGDNGIVDVKVDGTSVMDSEAIRVEVHKDAELGVIWVKIRGIQLDPGETKHIEITIATKEDVTNVSLHGTIIKYNFGRYNPEDAERPGEELGNSTEDREKATAGTSNTLKQKMKSEIASTGIMAENGENIVSTSSKPIPVVTVVAPEPGGGEGGVPELPTSGLVFIVATALVVALIAATVYFVARRTR